MLVAITRPVPEAISECALTYMSREPIDYDLAAGQHEDYVRLLQQLEASSVSLASTPQLPDSAFVEDTAVVVDELAVMTRPRLPSRQAEIESSRCVIQRYRPVTDLAGEGHLEGGDVLRLGRRLYVGLSSRTDADGIRGLEERVAPHGYSVTAVPVDRCLHLKTACTSVGRNTLLLNPAWVSRAVFQDFNVIETPVTEPFSANALLIGDTVVLPASFPEMAERVRAQGFKVVTIEFTELMKAEAGLTCCSILLEA
ncbi:MAG TPA: arginine deiminase family protein [Chloroflexota bacterium]|nr:arginine deiminase family protein [Chloroflexota bacterium]